jgi:uncharacterized protein YdaU (DUF1376 family)
MRNVEKDRGNFKTRAPWFKCFPTDWLEGTRGLTPEQRGVYFDCLCLLYRTEKPLPFDDKWMSFQLLISPRRWRTIRNALVALGKLVKTEQGYVNNRAENEIEDRVKQSRKSCETSPKVPKNPEVSTRARTHDQSQSLDTEVDSPPSPPSNVKPVSDWRTAFGGDDHGVEFQGGKLVLVNGTRADWLSKFGGDAEALDLALIEAAGSIQRNSPAGLKLQVERKLASIARERRDRGQRYAAAVQANAGKGAQPEFEDWRAKRQREAEEALKVVRSMQS